MIDNEKKMIENDIKYKKILVTKNQIEKLLNLYNDKEADDYNKSFLDKINEIKLWLKNNKENTIEIYTVKLKELQKLLKENEIKSNIENN